MTATHQVPGLSFDEIRLEERRKTLGASEIPAVAGVNPHRSALDVYLEKKGLSAPFAGNAFTEWGLRLEEPIAQKYAEVVGLELIGSEALAPSAMKTVEKPSTNSSADIITARREADGGSSLSTCSIVAPVR